MARCFQWFGTDSRGMHGEFHASLRSDRIQSRGFSSVLRTHCGNAYRYRRPALVPVRLGGVRPRCGDRRPRHAGRAPRGAGRGDLDIGAGQVGEIWISGRGVAPSYWHRPAETRRTFSVRLAGTSEGPFLRSGTPGFVPGRATAFSVGNGDQVQVHPVVLLPPEEIQKTSSGKIQQITAKAAAAVTEVPAASPPELTVADSAPARLYRWIRGSRVPADAAADAGSFLDPAARRPGERPCWASLAARSPSRCP